MSLRRDITTGLLCLRYTLWFFERAVLRTPLYVWTEQYETAVLELDPRELTIRVANAESVIQQRREALALEPTATKDET